MFLGQGNRENSFNTQQDTFMTSKYDKHSITTAAQLSKVKEGNLIVNIHDILKYLEMLC